MPTARSVRLSMTAKGCMLPSLRSWVRLSISAAIFAGSGIIVYQSRCNSPSGDGLGKIGRMVLPQWYDANMGSMRLELIWPDYHRRPLSPVFTAAIIQLPA